MNHSRIYASKLMQDSQAADAKLGQTFDLIEVIARVGGGKVRVTLVGHDRPIGLDAHEAAWLGQRLTEAAEVATRT